MLRIDNISLQLSERGRHFRLDVPHFRLETGERCVISGQSGSGKTLFLELLGLLRPPDSGDYILTLNTTMREIDMTALWLSSRANLARFRGQHLGFVLQSGGLIPFLSTRENIALPLQGNTKTKKNLTDELIEKLGLVSVSETRPPQLSMGQRQRVAIARAIVHRPTLLIADEPTSALDPDLRQTVYAMLSELSEAMGTAVVLSSHDADAAKLTKARTFQTVTKNDNKGMVVSKVVEVAA